MLSKKSIRIISVIALIVMMLMVFASPVMADGISGQISDNVNYDVINDTKAGNIAGTVLGAIKWIGVAIAIGMLMFLGIKYITSSPEGKADLKKQLGVYVLGFVLLVGATVIVGILETWAGSIA